MSKKVKEMMMGELSRRFTELRDNGAVVVNYEGVTAEQSVALRRAMRAQNVEYRVVKNSLLGRVLKDQGIVGYEDILQGPCAIIVAEDPVAGAKAATETAKKFDKLEIRGALVDGRALGPEKVEALSSIPPLEQLHAMIAGTIAAPIRKVLGTVKAVPQKLVSTLDEVRKQKEQTGA
jgi:large subunit ribosomal protein L10